MFDDDIATGIPCTVSTLGEARVLRLDLPQLTWRHVDALRELFEGFESTPVVLDLGGVRFMDTGALAVILSVARQRPAPLAVASVSDGVAPLFDLFDVDGRLTVVDRPSKAAGLLSRRLSA